MTSDYAVRLLCTTLICVFIPYLFNCCQDIAHYCSECGHAVAVQQYVYYRGAEGQRPTVFLPPKPPRPKVVPSRHAGSPNAALPKTVKAQPQEIEDQTFARGRKQTTPGDGKQAPPRDGKPKTATREKTQASPRHPPSTKASQLDIAAANI